MFDSFNSFYWGCDQIENNFWDYSTFIRYEKHFEDIRKLDGKILTAGVLKRKNWNKNIQKCNFGPTNNGPEQTPKVPRDYLVCLMPKLITTKMSNQKTIHISHYITKAITTYVIRCARSLAGGPWCTTTAGWMMRPRQPFSINIIMFIELRHCRCMHWKECLTTDPE